MKLCIQEEVKTIFESLTSQILHVTAYLTNSSF